MGYVSMLIFFLAITTNSLEGGFMNGYSKLGFRDANLWIHCVIWAFLRGCRDSTAVLCRSGISVSFVKAVS